MSSEGTEGGTSSAVCTSQVVRIIKMAAAGEKQSDLRSLLYPVEKTALGLHQPVSVHVEIAWESRSKQASRLHTSLLPSHADGPFPHWSKSMHVYSVIFQGRKPE